MCIADVRLLLIPVYVHIFIFFNVIEATSMAMENQDFSNDVNLGDDVISELEDVMSELSDVSEHSEVSTDDLISQEHWDIIISDEY